MPQLSNKICSETNSKLKEKYTVCLHIYFKGAVLPFAVQAQQYLNYLTRSVLREMQSENIKSSYTFTIKGA